MIQKESFGLTTPLLTNANGDKMGKTADGAIWLNEEFFSSYDYWQFWRNIDDEVVSKFLLLFTKLPIDEIQKQHQSFMNSIRNSLNHLLVIDKVWLANMKEEKHSFNHYFLI